MVFLFYCISVFFLTFGIYLQSGLGWTSLASGIGILPFAFGFFAGTLRSAKLYARIGNHILTSGSVCWPADLPQLPALCMPASASKVPSKYF